MGGTARVRAIRVRLDVTHGHDDASIVGLLTQLRVHLVRVRVRVRARVRFRVRASEYGRSMGVISSGQACHAMIAPPIAMRPSGAQPTWVGLGLRLR